MMQKYQTLKVNDLYEKIATLATKAESKAKQDKIKDSSI